MKYRFSTWLAVRTGIGIAMALVVLATAMAGCDKPSEEDCKKAVSHIQKLHKTAANSVGADEGAMVRACRGAASRESVQCVIAAKSITDLEKCPGFEAYSAQKAAGDKKVGGENETEGADQTADNESKNDGEK